MKLVVDTNVIFSALYDPDSSAGKLILKALEGEMELSAPESVKDELERNLMKKLHYTRMEVNEVLAALPVRWIEEEIYSPAVGLCRKYLTHKKDIPVLASAIVLEREIVSGDRHLLSIKPKLVKVWKLKEIIEALK